MIARNNSKTNVIFIRHDTTLQYSQLNVFSVLLDLKVFTININY